MTTTRTAVELSLAVVFIVSALLKFASPLAIEPLLRQLGVLSVSPRVASFVIGGAELAAGVAVYASSNWGLISAGALLSIFSVAIALVIRRGSRPRCGCLGDLSVARVSGVHLARNIALLSGALFALNAPGNHSAEALLPAVTLAFLILVVPEAVETIREFRANVRHELRATLESRGEA